MIERKTVIDQLAQNPAGFIDLRLAFVLIEDGVQTDSKWHKVTIPYHLDPAAHMATVNAHLSIMAPPMPPVSQADIDFVVQSHALLKQRMESV